MNARLIYSSIWYDHITPVLRRLHSLKFTEQICSSWPALGMFYHCADEFHRLRYPPASELSHTATSQITDRPRHATVNDRAFPVPAARVWDSLHHHCWTLGHPVHARRPIFNFRSLTFSAREVTIRLLSFKIL